MGATGVPYREREEIDPLRSGVARTCSGTAVAVEIVHCEEEEKNRYGLPMIQFKVEMIRRAAESNHAGITIALCVWALAHTRGQN
jgi:hypothetical protein